MSSLRNAFLLLILTVFVFSICSLMWKSLFEAKNTPAEEKEPTRVEKLVKGEDSTSMQEVEYFEPQMQQQEEFRRISEPNPQFNRKFEEPQNVQVQNEQTPPANLTIPNANEVMLKDITPEQIQAINAELVRKYGNNPNAEVSDEDLQKIIEQLLPAQNR